MQLIAIKYFNQLTALVFFLCQFVRACFSVLCFSQCSHFALGTFLGFFLLFQWFIFSKT